MPGESIAQLMRAGFPKEEISEGSYRTDIEYVGKSADLRAAAPDIADEWGDYNGRVTVARLEPIEMSDYSILVVAVEARFSQPEEPGELQEETSEVDWVVFQRPLHEHPEFREGGEYYLTSLDFTLFERWKETTDPQQKSEFRYETKPGSNVFVLLPAPARMYAQGYLRGYEFYDDYRPVGRWSSTYAKGPPPKGEAGKKQTPENIPNLPEGYEWIRTADRGLKKKGQTRWGRDVEWSGVDKVMIDNEKLYWTLPEG